MFFRLFIYLDCNFCFFLRPNSRILTTKKKQFTFPWWCKIIAYVLSIFCMLMCIFWILMKAIMLGEEKVGKWLTAFATSVFSDVLVKEPLKIILVTTFFVIITRKKHKEKEFDYDHLDRGRALHFYNTQSGLVKDSHRQALVNLFRK